MKKMIIALTLISMLMACGSNNIEEIGTQDTQLGNVALLFPLENETCEEGVFLSDSEIEIPFSWSVTENATSYRIEVIEVSSNETLNIQEGITGTSANLVLTPGTSYQWKVIATDGTSESESRLWSFYSSGLAEENYIPFPAEIDVIANNDGTARIEWEAFDIDGDISSFTISFGTSNPPSVIETGYTDDVYDVQIVQGQTYYLVIRTIDENGNYSDSKLSFEG